MMTIELYNYDYSKQTPRSQRAKVMAEVAEFLTACGEDDPSHESEEAFDVIQAIYGYMKVRGLDIKTENKRHLEKLRGRHE